MSKLEKTGLIGRIIENALNGDGIVPADVIELAELLDKNTQQTAKLYDQVQQLESYNESLSKLLAGTTARLNQVIEDNDLTVLEVEAPEDPEAEEQAAIEKAQHTEQAANDRQFQGAALPEDLQRVLGQFRDKPTIFIVSSK